MFLKMECRMEIIIKTKIMGMEAITETVRIRDDYICDSFLIYSE